MNTTASNPNEPAPEQTPDPNTLQPTWKDIYAKNTRKGTSILRGEHYPGMGIVITSLSAHGGNPITATEIFIPHAAVEELLGYLEDVSILEDLAQDRTSAK